MSIAAGSRCVSRESMQVRITQRAGSGAFAGGGATAKSRKREDLTKSSLKRMISETRDREPSKPATGGAAGAAAKARAGAAGATAGAAEAEAEAEAEPAAAAPAAATEAARAARKESRDRAI